MASENNLHEELALDFVRSGRSKNEQRQAYKKQSVGDTQSGSELCYLESETENRGSYAAPPSIATFVPQVAGQSVFGTRDTLNQQD